MWTTKAPDSSYSRDVSAPSSDPVVIAGVDIPFWDLVKFQVKFIVASIPAFVILMVMVAIAIGIVQSMIGK